MRGLSLSGYRGTLLKEAAACGLFWLVSVVVGTAAGLGVVLSGTLRTVPLLLLLAALKFVATSLTLGSGGSGGIFSPALFLGAMLGGSYGLLLKVAFPQWQAAPSAFALAGLAGMIASATGAPLTAIVMAFEISLDYEAILPIIITAAVSYGTRRLLLRESVYTMKLIRHGHSIPGSLRRGEIAST